MRTFFFGHVFAAPLFLGLTGLYFVANFWPIGVLPMLLYMVYPHFGVLGFSLITILDEDFLDSGTLRFDRSIRWFMFFGVVLSGFFYLTIAIYIDYRRNKLPPKKEEKENQADDKNTQKISTHSIEVINQRGVTLEDEAARTEDP